MRLTGTSRITAAAAVGVAAIVLTACGSDAPPEAPAPNFGTVTGAARNIDFPAQVDRSDYPNACRLMPNDSMQALIGAPVTSGRTTAGCNWSGGEASLPSVTLQFVEIGEDAESVYDQRQPESSSGVNGVGGQTRIYRLNENMTTRIDVLKSNAFFRVQVQLTSTTQQDLDNAERIGTRVAQLVGDQIS